MIIHLFYVSKTDLQFDPETGKRHGITNSAKHIHTFIDHSIERLGTTPDLYYLHRRDPNTPLEESVGALAEIKAQGKCKYIGISEPSVATLRAACKSVSCPTSLYIGHASQCVPALTCAVAHIDAVQIEYSPFCLQPELNGMLDACRELGVAVVAFSPLGAGFLTGKFTDPEQFKGDLRGSSPRFQGEAFKENLKLLKTFEGIAADKGCTSSQLALAWVANQGAIPIPGTKSVSRLEENWGAHGVDLTDEDMRRIRECIKVGVQGER